MFDADRGFRGFLAEYITKEARPIDKLGHQPRLYALASEVGAGLDYDDDIVYAAAWLHDLGVFLGHRPEDPQELARWDNVRYAVERAPAILRQSGFSSAKIPGVVEAIRQHQPQARPEAIEAVLIHDADILEQLGSIGIMRIVAKIGRDTRYRTFTEAAETLRRNLDVLPGLLIHRQAQILAQSRIRMLKDFLRELDLEAMGELH